LRENKIKQNDKTVPTWERFYCKTKTTPYIYDSAAQTLTKYRTKKAPKRVLFVLVAEAGFEPHDLRVMRGPSFLYQKICPKLSKFDGFRT